jgi:hypothetical protein
VIRGRDLVAEWLDAVQHGAASNAEAAARIGVSLSRLEKSIGRARAAGDPRVPKRVPRTKLVDNLNVQGPVGVEPQQVAAAVRCVARYANNTADMELLLSVLGLDGAA